jgi:hypothetical protein
MVMRVTPRLLLLTVLLSGCASFNRVLLTEDEPKGNAPVGTGTAHRTARVVAPLANDQPASCDRTHRDLTIAWDARRYLCVREGRHAAFLKAGGWQLPKRINRPLPVSNTNLPPQQDPATQAVVLSPLAAMGPAPLQDRFTVSSAAGDPGVLEVPVADASSEVLEGPTGEHGAVDKTVSGDTQSVRIWFAPAQAQLGEKGLARSLALLPDIQAARRVTLLGVFEDDELTGEPGPLDRERFSVARALSVRDLWIEQGVDPAKLIILHHQDRLAGRYVEVRLHD